MSAFISEVMRNGFDATYLKGKKLTNQVAKQGRNLKTAMEPDDVHKVAKQGRNLKTAMEPDDVHKVIGVEVSPASKKESQWELHRCIRSTLATFLSNKRVGNLAK
ncbi:hypothetical protein DAPPUDRAFT_247836 [Daphnia pulex]|uniref:Uncharacterized protein n=1 Tax=Daphnia pulex TaxID=6669 RepID=E9GSZ1_DAPPU|nr:hypothetical protein DAPPUDRAFT_247836 [Daphnia pulex]|eukprot:EFX77276.1 hypothetical protein DAPPUDRAFT_247836 [Daphnia pulex]